MISKKTISILGAGVSGTGAALLAAMKGYDVFVSDAGTIKDSTKKSYREVGINFEEGGHTFTKLEKSSEVIKSPGIPYSNDIVVQLKDKNIPVIDEIEFASRYAKGKTVAITGTNGKTTTTLLLNHILNGAGINSTAVGNVGNSWAYELTKNDFDVWVLELSSFQIEGITTFSPDIFIITNISPDHLNRYGDMDTYTNAKVSLIDHLNNSSYFIYHNDEGQLKNTVERHKTKAHQFTLGSNPRDYVSVSSELVIVGESEDSNSYYTSKFSLKGWHNYQNAGFCAFAAEKLGIEKSKIEQGLATFTPVKHRMEPVGQIEGIEFINDSKATNLDAVKYALGSFNKPVIWIAGGVDKGNEYSEIFDLVRKKVKALICLGKDNTELVEAFSKITTVVSTDNMSECLLESFTRAESGDIVLLSPACASFDLFSSYEDRGDQFRTAFHTLKKEKEVQL